MKAKKCKYCSKEFTPTQPLQNCCSYDCKVKKDIDKEKERKKIAKEKKKYSVSALTKKADDIFGQYIRLRDSLATTGNPEKCKCITCGWVVSTIQCGHFITRASRSVRWVEQNANGQCPQCNCWGGGRQYEHGKAIDLKYGDGTAERLLKLGHEPQKVTREFLEEIIREYKEKLENL